uniref:RRM domain-containing protein n=1 Tax=Ananas comosus var. bracteatus TaxID=296719 RepID=A0A6V7NK18_ANACO|nr:unnamed protein product [Ananas comosus var. bracteatus]
MGKKSKEQLSVPELCDAVKSLFSADNPFRRKPSSEPTLGAPQPAPALGSPATAAEDPEYPQNVSTKDKKRRREKDGNPNPSPSSAPDSILKKRKKLGKEEEEEEEGRESPKKKRRKRKRDEIEEEYEQRKYGGGGAAAENGEEGGGGGGGGGGGEVVVRVGGKRKADDVASEAAAAAAKEDESFDDESKLVRTVFVGNLPVKTKKKAVLKEFGKFGRSNRLGYDRKIPRKGAIIKGKINDAVDSIHAYIVFKDEQSTHAALSNNMALIGGNHIRVDMACPPRKKLKGDAPLYDRKRTVFVGNLPFDVKDEELYQLFCGASASESNIEAVRVIRDPHTSLGKGIAYVLFKTREAANSIVRKRDLQIRDRILRLCHVKSIDATPTKQKDDEKKKNLRQKRLATNPNETLSEKNGKPRAKAAALSYQGLRSSKSGVLKKTRLHSSKKGRNEGNKRAGGVVDHQARKSKRPAVAARKAKQLLKKRKLESATPENMHRNKKLRKQ